MGTASFKGLRSDLARGAFEEVPDIGQRCVRFEDATLWFPEGYEAPGAQVGFAFVGMIAVLSMVGALIGFVDGDTYAWYCLLAGALSGLGLWSLSQASKRKKKKKEATLSCGVFLFSEKIVIREPGHDRSRARDRFVGTKVRSAFQGEGKSTQYLTLVAKDGGEDLHTQLKGPGRALVNAWLQEATPD